MKEYKELINIIYKKDSSYEKMAETSAIIENLFYELKETHPEMYEKYIKQFEEIAYEISEEESKNIIKSMKPFGMKWDYETIKKYLSDKGINKHYCRWWLVMNMTYNDYYKTAETVNMQDNPEFYFNLSKDFIEDIDAEPYKVEKYFLK